MLSNKHAKLTAGILVTGALATWGLLGLPGGALADPPPHNHGGGGGDGDTTPPGPVTDLAAGEAGFGSIGLTWTAVGDDGGGTGACAGAGRASAYDIRYSTTLIETDGDFEAALQADGEPTPLPCGGAEFLFLCDLEPGVTYYVAMKVEDEAGNASALSNLTSAGAGAMAGVVMHIADVRVSYTLRGRSRGVFTLVTILDENGNPVRGAEVIGVWDGCSFNGQTGAAVTVCNGVALIEKNGKCTNGLCEFVFTVTDVTHASMVYDPDGNVEDSDSIFCF